MNDFVRRRDDSPVELSHDTIKDACNYVPGLGATSEPLPESLGDHLSPHGYTARIETGVEPSELTNTVERDTASLPIVELSESYLHNADGYEVQAGMHGEAIPHTVIVFTVNHDVIQFFDPYEDFYAPPENGGGPPSQLPKSQFYQWWAEGTSRWTMWVEQEPQRTLGQTNELADEEQ